MRLVPENPTVVKHVEKTETMMPQHVLAQTDSLKKSLMVKKFVPLVNTHVKLVSPLLTVKNVKRTEKTLQIVLVQMEHTILKKKNAHLVISTIVQLVKIHQLTVKYVPKEEILPQTVHVLLDGITTEYVRVVLTHVLNVIHAPLVVLNVLVLTELKIIQLLTTVNVKMVIMITERITVQPVTSNVPLVLI